MVVGARSAIFAPTPNLGLIVLDEEHESSFKQESVPRYHARDVAVARAAAEGIPLVLGSATPSLESWHRAQSGQYTLVEMPRRVLDRPMPAVGTIDLRGERTGGSLSRGAISRPMHAAITTALDEGGQVILLLNRRGFSTHIQCPACGFVVRCPECDIALTHHRTRRDRLVPLLRLRGAGAASLPVVRLRRHPLQRPGHAAAGSGGPRPLPQRAEPADGHRRHAGPRQPRAGAGGVPLGQGPHPAGHANDRQGARFSQRHAGRA